MVKRVTISLPDDLAERLQEHGGDLNVSRVCQDALNTRLERIEALSSGVKKLTTMESVIERLRKQRKEHENECELDGERYGLEFCKIADYADLKYAATTFLEGTIILGGANPVGYNDIFKDDILSEYFEEYEDDESLDHLYAGDDDWLGEEACRWWGGWCVAVHKFWTDIQDKL